MTPKLLVAVSHMQKPEWCFAVNITYSKTGKFGEGRPTSRLILVRIEVAGQSAEETIHVIGGGPNERMRDDAAQRAIDAPVDEETQSAISKRIDPVGIVGPAGVRVRRRVDVLLRG